MRPQTFLIPNQGLTPKVWHLITLFWIVVTFLLWFNSPFAALPKPGEVVQALQELWTNDNLAVEWFTSFQLNAEALLCGSVISLGLAYLSTIGLFKIPVIFAGKLRFLSMIGLSFAFTVMTNNQHQLKLSMLTFSISVFLITSLLDVVSGIPKYQFDLARTLKMNEWQVLWEVVILGQFDQALVAIRQNAAIGYMMLTTVEAMARSDGGIGGLLVNQNKYLHLNAIMAIQILILATGLLQDYSLGKLRTTICSYVNFRRS